VADGDVRRELNLADTGSQDVKERMKVVDETRRLTQDAYRDSRVVKSEWSERCEANKSRINDARGYLSSDNDQLDEQKTLLSRWDELVSDICQLQLDIITERTELAVANMSLFALDASGGDIVQRHRLQFFRVVKLCEVEELERCVEWQTKHLLDELFKGANKISSDACKRDPGLTNLMKPICRAYTES